jgi:hypothetical protein
MFDIKIDMMRVMERHEMLLFFGKQLPGATVAAVNDSLIEIQEKVVDALGGVVNAPRSQVENKILIEPASRTSLIAATGSIYISRELIPLKYFNPIQGTKGVVYSPVSGVSKTVRNAFGPGIQRLGNGVWRRQGRSRLPIEKVPGFSMFKSKIVKATVARVVSQSESILKRNMDARVNEFMTNLQRGVRLTFGPTYINRNRNALISFGRFRSVLNTRSRR